MLARNVRNGISDMRGMLTRVMELSQSIGGFGDGPALREQIQSTVRSLMSKSQEVKGQIAHMRDTSDPEEGAVQQEFQELSQQMQQQLPGLIQRLKDSAKANESSAPREVYNQSLLVDQQMLDGETEELEMLQNAVQDILAQMREVNQLFQQTHEEIQRQRHMLNSIETYTGNALSEMSEGNEQLSKAQQHQKSSGRCLCWIFIILGVCAGGIILFLIIYFGAKK